MGGGGGLLTGRSGPPPSRLGLGRAWEVHTSQLAVHVTRDELRSLRRSRRPLTVSISPGMASEMGEAETWRRGQRAASR